MEGEIIMANDNVIGKDLLAGLVSEKSDLSKKDAQAPIEALMETVIKILEDLLYFVEAQIQEGQVAADYQEVGKIAEIPEGAEIETSNVGNHAKSQYSEIYQSDC